MRTNERDPTVFGKRSQRADGRVIFSALMVVSASAILPTSCASKPPRTLETPVYVPPSVSDTAELDTKLKAKQPASAEPVATKKLLRTAQYCIDEKTAKWSIEELSVPSCAQRERQRGSDNPCEKVQSCVDFRRAKNQHPFVTCRVYENEREAALGSMTMTFTTYECDPYP